MKNDPEDTTPATEHSATPDPAGATPDNEMSADQAQALAEQFRQDYVALRDELGKVIVGQRDVLDAVLAAFFAGGHVLLEGVPGLGKTVLVRTLAQAVDLSFSRIQFTPDLMPADIIGTDVIVETPDGAKEFRFQRGPVFANIVLADEINRATPKTQSALLEAMQEHHVSVGSTTHELSEPFLVLATQNPLEMEGTYPLPEAQLDRFFFKIRVEYPSAEELHEIANRTTQHYNPELREVLTREQVLKHREFVRQVPLVREVQDEVIQLVLQTHPQNAPKDSLAARYSRYGASPRGVQAVILAAKIFALMDNRFHVSRKDIHKAIPGALRHRMILNFEGEAEGHSTDDLLEDLIRRRS
jgi:MoxR-like ATPase